MFPSRWIFYFIFSITQLFWLKCAAITPNTFDSLTEIIDKSSDPVVKAEASIYRAKIHGYKNPVMCINDYLSAITICEEYKLHPKIMEVQKTFLSYLYSSGRYQLCMHYYLIFSEYLINNGLTDELPQLHNIYGNLLSWQKNYSQALFYYYSSLVYAVKKNDAELQHKSYLNIGLTRYKLGNFQSAAHYANKAIPYYREYKPRELNNILEIKAEAYFNMGFSDTAKTISYQILKGPFYNYYMTAYANKILASVFQHENKFDSALVRAKQALHLANLFGSKELAGEVSVLLSNLYESKNDYKNAFHYHKLHKLYTDSLQQLKETEALDNLQLNFKIAINQQKIQEQTQTIQKARYKLYLLVFGIFLFIVLFIFSVIAYRHKKKSGELIAEQKKLIEEKNQEMQDSIRYAQKIQEALLANKELANQVIPDSLLVFEPRDIVSGDFYWAAKKEKYFYLAVCDSTGHGVPGAFMSLLNINYLNEAVNNNYEPHAIFNDVRQRLSKAFAGNERKDGMDGIIICLDTESAVLTYTAAQNKPILAGPDGVKQLPADKMHVGIGLTNKPFQTYTINYQKGTMLYLNTDGFCDQFGGPNQKKFMQKRLAELLATIYNLPCEEQKKVLLNAFLSWKGTQDQVDDVCLIGIRL